MIEELRLLVNRIAELERRIDDVDRRQNGLLTEGVIEEVDFANATATVLAEGIQTKKVPWLTRAGDINEWDPPTVGERVLIASPAGDHGRALILPGGYTDSVAAPHDQGGEFVRVTGDVRHTQTAEVHKVEVGDTTVEISADGVTITVGGVSMEITSGGVTYTGGRIEHDGKNIGTDHRHDEVMKGAALTGEPVE